MIVFVRHGETALNRRGAAVGRADPVLTAKGREQAAAAAQALAGLDAALVLTSPLLRAHETATAIGEVIDAPVQVDPRLIELDYGEWDEKEWSDLPPDDVKRWRTDATFSPPGGESLHAVTERVASFCAERLDGPTVVAVSHVSPIKAAVTWSLGIGDEHSWRMFLGLASITRIGARDTHPVLLSFNETAHITG